MITKCEKCGGFKTAGAIFQTKRYGENMRVHNITKDGCGRCTICGNVKIKVTKK
jgi:hypothetical protein